MRIETRTALLICAAWAAAAAQAASPSPEASVTGGKIRGTIASYGGAVFKGIPFAQPPTGELRWREPMPVKGWSGVRDANEFSAPCTQGGKSSEDCLYLNLWTPEWPAKSRQAVMVW